jgi:hypothetical protein
MWTSYNRLIQYNSISPLDRSCCVVVVLFRSVVSHWSQLMAYEENILILANLVGFGVIGLTHFDILEKGNQRKTR